MSSAMQCILLLNAYLTVTGKKNIIFFYFYFFYFGTSAKLYYFEMLRSDITDM